MLAIKLCSYMFSERTVHFIEQEAVLSGLGDITSSPWQRCPSQLQITFSNFASCHRDESALDKGSYPCFLILQKRHFRYRLRDLSKPECWITLAEKMLALHLFQETTLLTAAEICSCMGKPLIWWIAVQLAEMFASTGCMWLRCKCGLQAFCSNRGWGMCDGLC